MCWHGGVQLLKRCYCVLQDGYTQDGFDSLDECEDEREAPAVSLRDLWVHRFSHTLRYKDRLWLVSIDAPSTLYPSQVVQQADQGTRHKNGQLTTFFVNERSIGPVPVKNQCYCARLEEHVIVYEWFDVRLPGQSCIQVMSDATGLTDCKCP